MKNIIIFSLIAVFLFANLTACGLLSEDELSYEGIFTTDIGWNWFSDKLYIIKNEEDSEEFLTHIPDYLLSRDEWSDIWSDVSWVDSLVVVYLAEFGTWWGDATQESKLLKLETEENWIIEHKVFGSENDTIYFDDPIAQMMYFVVSRDVFNENDEVIYNCELILK